MSTKHIWINLFDESQVLVLSINRAFVKIIPDRQRVGGINQCHVRDGQDMMAKPLLAKLLCQQTHDQLRIWGHPRPTMQILNQPNHPMPECPKPVLSVPSQESIHRHELVRQRKTNPLQGNKPRDERQTCSLARPGSLPRSKRYKRLETRLSQVVVTELYK